MENEEIFENDVSRKWKNVTDEGRKTGYIYQNKSNTFIGVSVVATTAGSGQICSASVEMGDDVNELALFTKNRVSGTTSGQVTSAHATIPPHYFYRIDIEGALVSWWERN